MLRLFRIQGFAPYLIIAFLNAFTDLGHKIIVQNAIFKVYSGTTQVIFTTLVNACIVLPFVFFFTPTGWLADKFPKDRIIKIAALTAIPLTGAITLAYSMGWFEVAFACTLLLGTQAAFYSPAKYGYIKELTGKEHIATANAYVQAVTIAAILGGTVLFSALFEYLLPPNLTTIQDIMRSAMPLGWVLVGCSALECLLAFRLPQQRETDHAMRFDLKKYLSFGYLRENLAGVRHSQVIWLSIIGIAVFWGINQVVLASFPAYMKDTLGIQNTTIANGLMGLAGVGVILGSFIAGKASERFIETGIVPLGALGITASLVVVPLLSNVWLLAGLFFFYGVMGGLFIIPLNALIQFNAAHDEAGTVLAANNFLQNLLMSSFLLITALLTSVFQVDTVFFLYAMALVAFAGTLFSLSKLPQAFVRYVVAVLVSQRYKLRVFGLENLPSTGGVLLLGNHASWFDWAMLQIACPRPVRFVMLRSIYEHPVLKPLFDIFGVIPIAPGKGSEEALQAVKKALAQGEVVAMFPEGRISRNGQLADFKRGFERAIPEHSLSGLSAEHSIPVVIVPFYLRGLWGTAFSYATSTLRRSDVHGAKRLITVAFGERMPATSTAQMVKQRVIRLATETWQRYSNTLQAPHLAWLRSAKAYPRRVAITDASKRRLTHIGLLATTIAHAQTIKRLLPPAERYVGVLLPTSIEAAQTLLALWMNGNIPVMLDYSSSADDVARSLNLTAVRTVITSTAFEGELFQQSPHAASALAEKRRLYVEDLQQSSANRAVIGLRGRWLTALTALAPVWLLRLFYAHTPHLDDTAAVLFSGYGEKLRAVELTHRNIVGNIRQIVETFNPREDDVVLAVLPFCEAFGCIVSVLMPLVSGLGVVCEVRPLNALAVGKQAARNEATVLFATPTLLKIYAESEDLHALMFASLRMVISGGKALPEATQKEFRQKFGLNIYEGFGTTETTPVATVNVPDVMTPGDWKVQIGTKPGTVGLPLPGSAVSVVHPGTFAEMPHGEEGVVLLAGPQVMKGYYNDAERTRAVLLERDGLLWYNTGRRGTIDGDGFLRLTDE